MAYAEDDKKKVKRGVIITLIGKVAEMSQGVYLFLARYLFGGEAFGLFVIGFNVMELLARFLSGGFGDAATFYSAKYIGNEEDSDEENLYSCLNTVIWFPVFLSLLMSVGIYFLIDPIYDWIWSQHDVQLKSMLRLYAWVLPLIVLVKVPLQAIKGHMEMAWPVAIENTAIPLLHLGTTAIFFLLGTGAEGLVYSSLLSYAILVPFSWYAFSRYFSMVKLFKNISISRETLSFSIPQSFNMMMNFGLVKVDGIMLSAFLGANQVGVYTLVAELFRSIRSAKTSFSSVFAPLVAKYKKQNNRRGIEESLWSISNSTAMFSIPLFAVIQFFFFDIVNGPGSIWTYSLLIPWLLAIGPMMSCFFGLSGNILLMTGHTKLLLVNSMSLMGVNVFLNYLLIPPLGMLGAALATAISGLGISITQVIQLKKVENIGFDYKSHVMIFIKSLPVLLGVVWVQSSYYLEMVEAYSPMVRLLIKGALLVLIFLFCVYFLLPQSFKNKIFKRNKLAP